MTLDLVNITVLLLALGLLQGFILGAFNKRPLVMNLVSGLLFATACVFAMTIDIEISPGQGADANALIISLGALFGGAVVAAVSVSIMVIYLFSIAIGNQVEIIILFSSALLGLGFRHAMTRNLIEPGFLELLAFGFVVHAMAGLLAIQFDSNSLASGWSYLTLPMIVIFSLATALLGILLSDIENRVKNENDLIESQVLLANHLENTPLAAISWDRDFRCTQWNKAAERIFGYSAEEALGRRGTELLVHESNHEELEKFYSLLLESNQGSQRVNENVTRDGRIITCEWYNTPIYDDNGKTIGIASLSEDITDKKQAEELIWKQANFDPLTGLANRKMLQDRLRQEIRKAQRTRQSVALIYLDLDQFKDINDTLGHHIGDILLQEAANRLTDNVRESDTVARLGGDEFTIVMGALDDLSSVERIASVVLKQMAEPFVLDPETAYVSASIGITFYPQDGTEVDELFKNADHAMYAAKNLGRNCFQYFQPAMQQEAMARMSTVKDLHHALSMNQFVLHYQPIKNLATGGITRCEALIRWNHPTRGLLYPDAFIAYAEDSRLIDDIGDWVYREALRQVKKWRRNYNAEFQVCINASPAQFDAHEAQVDQWIDYLQELDLPGSSVTIEITESLLMENVEKFTNTLLMFRDAGIQVSLDDFGTGYSSLSYLKKFDIDYLKIDRSFVQNLSLDSDDLILCRAIIAMAHKLGLKVVAEGIETMQQQSLLQSADCDYGQGYLFSRPVPAEDIEKLLEDLSKAS